MPTAVNRSQVLTGSSSQLSQGSSQQSQSPSQHSRRSTQSQNDTETPRAQSRGTSSSKHSQQSQGPTDKILFRLETEHPKVLIGMLMSFGSSSSSSGSSSSRSRQSQKASTATQATITQNMMLNTSTNTAIGDMAASIGQMTIYSTETGLQLHQSSNLSSQSSMELPKELFSYYQTSANPSSDSVGGASQTSQQSNNNSNCCCCISWKPLRNALILAMTQNPNKLSMTYNINDEVLHVETECGAGMLRHKRNSHNHSTASTASSATTGVVCTAVISGLVPPDEEPQLSQAFLQHSIVARILVPSAILMDVMELALVSPMAIQLQWKTTTLHTATETKKSVLQVTAVGPCSECAVQWQIPIEWTENNGIEREVEDDDDTLTADGVDDDTLTRASSLDDGSNSIRRNKRKSRRNTKRTVRKVKHSYPYEAWAQAMKPLLDSQAHETCISVNEQGILAIQHQLLCHDNIAAFCDGLLVPLILEDDDDGDSEDHYDSEDDDRTEASSSVMTGRSSKYSQGSAASASRGSSRDDRAETHFTPTQSSTVGNNDSDQDDDGDDQSRANSQRPNDLPQPSAPASKNQGNNNDDDESRPGSGGIEPSFFGALPGVDDAAEGGVGKRSSSRLSNGSAGSSSRRRREERKRLRAQQRRSSSGSEVNQSTSSLSPVILPSNDSPPDHLEADHDHSMEASQTQDDDDDERYCSSPEVVYGRM